MSVLDRKVLTYVAILFFVALVSGTVLTESRARSSAPHARADAGGAPLPDLSGTWSGQWVDTVFVVTGPMEWTIVQDASTVAFDATCDLTGVSLGPAEPASGSGTIAADVMTFSFAMDGSSTLTSTGDITVTGGSPGNFIGDGTVGAPLSFGDYTMTATATETSIIGTFEYTFGIGAGTIVMNRTSPVEPESWGSLKARYRDPGE